MLSFTRYYRNALNGVLKLFDVVLLVCECHEERDDKNERRENQAREKT